VALLFEQGQSSGGRRARTGRSTATYPSDGSGTCLVPFA